MSRDNIATLDGLVVGYGTRDSINPQDAVVHTLGRIKQQEIKIDVSNFTEFEVDVLPVEGATKAFTIPAGSSIQAVTWVTGTAWADLTSIAMGLKDTATGAVLHTVDDTLITDVEGILASMGAGEKIVGLGTLTLSGALTTSADSLVMLTITGTPPTAGTATVLVEYIEPTASQTSPAVIVGKI
jgi:hypothetical protein